MTDQDRMRAAIEATRLGFGLTAATVHDLANQVAALRVRGICVPLPFIPAARRVLEAAGVGPRGVDVVCVANFPHAIQPLDSVLAEVRAAAVCEVDHLDVVVPGHLVAARDAYGLSHFFRRIVEAGAEASGGSLRYKAILETAAFDPDRIRMTAGAAIEAGFHWLKTSTGFHPAGGATPDAVRLLRELAPGKVGVKASGGIRTRDAALAMLEAGADRLGTSAERSILAAE